MEHTIVAQADSDQTNAEPVPQDPRIRTPETKIAQMAREVVQLKRKNVELKTQLRLKEEDNFENRSSSSNHASKVPKCIGDGHA